MKKGQLLFVKGHSLVSKLIQSFDGPYSHVAIALSDNTILEAQRFTESRIVKNYHEDYDILDLNLTDEQLDILTDKALEMIGYDYDYKQVVFTMFNNLFKVARVNNRDKYICSELIVDLLFNIGYIDKSIHQPIINATPNELHRFLFSIKVSRDLYK